MNKTFSASLSACLIALAAGTSATAFAADDAASAAMLTKPEAKSLKATSEGDYKARKNIAEAQENLDKADCKANLDGSVKRACNKSAKAAAKSTKADANLVHEAEEKAIKNAKP